MDIDNSGSIEVQELRDAFMKIKSNTPTKSSSQEELSQVDMDRIDEIIKKIDYDGNGSVDYTEFLAHSLTEK